MSTDPREVATALRAHVEQDIGKLASINDDQSEYSWRRAQADRGRQLNAFAAAAPADLVSGVLTRISEIERAEANRLVETDADWYRDQDLVVHGECRQCGYRWDGPADEVEPAAVKHMAEQHGTDALRLCRAHRQIVDEHASLHTHVDTDEGRWCADCGFPADECTKYVAALGCWFGCSGGGPEVKQYRIFLCGGDMRPGPRETDCPDPLHDFPLPSGYIEASEEAGSRLSRGWNNTRCDRCGRYGWRPGKPRKGEQLVRARPTSEQARLVEEDRNGQ